MRYKFNLKIQLIYGLISFIAALLIVYLFIKSFDWLTAGIVGMFEFIVSGFYTRMNKKIHSSGKR